MARGASFNRRTFIAGSVAASIASRSLAAQQTSGAKRIAIIVRPGQGGDMTPPGELRYWHEWREELRRLGYIEGENLLVDIRTVDPSGVGELAAELAQDPPEAIFAPSQNIVVLLKAASVSIPIVAVPVDPVGSGLVASLSRPGGNITGLTLDAGLETAAKRFELLKEVAPNISTIAILILRPYWEGKWNALFTEAARQFGIAAIGAPFGSHASEAEYRNLFAGMVDDHADGLYITPALENLTHRRLIAELAISAKLPSISFYRENVEAGGLMAYGPDIDDIFRRAAGYLDQILNGADPADMPIQQPVKFNLDLNLKTAKALELSIPPNLLALANEVFE